jgi:hypothetical protein
MTDRREFLRHIIQLGGVSLLLPSLQRCHNKAEISGAMLGANHKVGHLLRDKSKIPPVSSILRTDILIAGGGISGLSAKRWLERKGKKDVMMVEMGDKIGGNSVFGRNDVSAYPWGAHYLPVPDAKNKELVDFLHLSGVIDSFNEEGLPVYNEYHLCHDPEERLYINGYWQEGIVPEFGVAEADKRQIKSFFESVESIKKEKGSDGKYFFAIPVDTSSVDDKYKKLDKISFAGYLASSGFTSPVLLWYLEYCCKDDYGTGLNETSAWAGIHYFASRRGRGANASASSVLTWPQGNGFLMDHLRVQCDNSNIYTDRLVYDISIQEDLVVALCYDAKAHKSVAIHANRILLSTPQYVNERLLPAHLADRGFIYDSVQYAPWVIANITLSQFPNSHGQPLSWDNVIYGQDSVGYVNANHQDLGPHKNCVITYYLPIASANTKDARNSIYGKDYDYWKDYIINDLEYAHPGITSLITRLDVWIWGHGMIRPSVNYIWGGDRIRAMMPIDDKVFFAHSDLSGISIFEEAFYQGIRAANEILKADEAIL